MAEETIDPGLLEQTKNQIRKLVAEIADLAESDIQPAEFHSEFLTRVVAAVAASGGALWMLDGKGGLKLQHQLEFRLTGLMDGKARTQPHDALLGCMIQASQPQIIPPGATVEGVPGAGNPTGFALIIAPLQVDKQVVGLVEILMDPTRRAATQKSTLRFVSDLCDLAGQYLKNRQMRQMMSQQRLWNQLEGFTHTVHASLDLKETAYAVANDGKRLIGCDRLSVALKIGGRAFVEAVSGQEIVEQRANLIRELTKLCKVVIKSGEDLVYTGSTEGFPPDIRDALEVYVDESGSKAAVITLLHKPESDPSKEKVPFGCLVAEQIGEELALTDTHARTEVVARHASTALWNARDHDRIFLRPLLKAIGTPARFFRGRMLAKIVAVLVALLTSILVLAFVHWELTIEGRGSLLPENRRLTYAPVAGIVARVPVEHGQVVREGDVLAEIESSELDKERARLVAERIAAETQRVNLESQIRRTVGREEERITLRGQQEEARIKAESAARQIEIIDDQLETMIVRAPHDGIVTTWEVKKNLEQRPVEIGQELISIAATGGDWVLEVEVPDDDMAPVLAAQAKLEARVKARTGWESERRKAEGEAARLAAQIEKTSRPEEKPALQAQQEKARARARDAAEQVRIITAQLDKTTVRLPAGVVVTPEADAVASGLALPAYFVSMTDPEHRYHGYVRRIASKAETKEDEHVVKVTVGFSDAVRKDFLTRNQELRPGAEVRARVQCGDARLAYVMFRDVIQVFYESVLFRWPFLN